jgi:hypothetical protein
LLLLYGYPLSAVTRKCDAILKKEISQKALNIDLVVKYFLPYVIIIIIIIIILNIIILF